MQSPGRSAFESGQGGGTADLREHNLSLVLRHVRDHGPSSRADIAQACGLGVSTLSDLIGELRRRALADEADPLPAKGAGRPVRPIVLTGNPWATLAIGLDVDGIQARVVTPAGHTIGEFQVELDLRRSSPQVGLRAVQRVVSQALDVAGPERRLISIEIAVPGSVARAEGIVGWSAPLEWRDVEVAAALRRHLTRLGLPAVHIGVDNDQNLAALAAARSGLGPRDCVYFGGLRGIGGGVIMSGELFRGTHGGAAEFGHLMVESDGRPCWCGRRGCLETQAGLTTLLVDSQLRRPAGAARLVAANPVAARVLLVEQAEDGNPEVLATLERAGRYLGAAIDETLAVLNPAVALLGGYLGELSPFMMGAVQDRIAVTRGYASFRSTEVLAIPASAPGVSILDGAAYAARDACLTQPLQLTYAVND